MNRPHPVLFLLAAVLLLASIAGPAGADLTVEMKQDGSTHTMYVAEHRFRVEHPDATMIFRGDENLLWIVQSGEKEYVELTEEKLQEIGSKLEEAQAKMKEALEGMPPEQRAMAEKMMAGRMPAGMMDAGGEKTVEEMGQSRKINGFQTSGYQVFLDGALAEEVWSASPQDLGVTREDLAVFEEFADFMKTAVPGMEEMIDRYSMHFDEPAEGQVPGFPVLSIRKDDEGDDAGRTEVVGIQKGEVAASRFELPEGLKKKTLDF